MQRSEKEPIPDHCDRQRRIIRAVDVAIGFGLVSNPRGVIGEVFCGQPLLICVRPVRPERRSDFWLSSKDETLVMLHAQVHPWCRAARNIPACIDVSRAPTIYT